MSQSTRDARAPGRVRWTYPSLAAIATAVVVTVIVLQRSPAPASADYRSRMRDVSVATAFESAAPDRSLLPTGREWVAHLQQDLLPYWTSAAALGNPIGNFPTSRADDGSVIDPKRPVPEVTRIPAGETWLLNRLGRQYTRTMSRQIFAYCVAYHIFTALRRRGGETVGGPPSGHQ